MDFLYILKDLKYEGSPKRIDTASFEALVSIIVGINGELKGFVKTHTIPIQFGSTLSANDVEAFIVKKAQEFVDVNYNNITI